MSERTPVISLGPLNLVIALTIVPAIIVYERVRRWRDERRAKAVRRG